MSFGILLVIILAPGLAMLLRTAAMQSEWWAMFLILCAVLLPCMSLSLAVEFASGFDGRYCPSCHYDMRGHANTDSTVCPECGGSLPPNLNKAAQDRESD
jgi:hypothetical protein